MQEAIKKDHNILCLDNLLTGSLKNLSDIIDNPNFEFINHDIVIPFYRDGIDEIYNLACPHRLFNTKSTQ